MASNNQSQYINTMVFCIVAGIISLMLLLLVFNANDVVRTFSPLVITVEVGLIFVIILAIWKIIYYERSVESDAKKAYDAKLNVTTCPDYWTLSGKKCRNEFQPHPNVTYRFFGKAEIDDKPVREFKLADFNNLSVSQTCEKVQIGGDGVNKLASGYVPWSQVDSICGSYRLKN